MPGGLFDTRCALEETLRKNVERVDLREANSVFRNDVVKDVPRFARRTGWRLFRGTQYA